MHAKQVLMERSNFHLNQCAWVRLVFVGVFLTWQPFSAWAQIPKELAVNSDYKKLTVEELMNIEVISVTKIPEKLSEVASAIQVITQQDIQRSAATSIPEALRLAPNLQVAQLSSQHWIISARGFNWIYANKLLVMIDGRTLYSPLFAGVFWDAQNLLLENVERIEVISGPGGTLWGANAVNGVINIITKHSGDTKGIYVSAGLGSSLRQMAETRLGGHIGSKFSYRAYGTYNNRNHTYISGAADNKDKWSFGQGGFRLDWNASASNSISLHGNSYNGGDGLEPKARSIDGQNVMAKWSHAFSNTSSLTVQGYFDRTWRRDVPGTINDQLKTYDLDVQHQFGLGTRQRFLWGLGYRIMDDESQHSTIFVGLVPESRTMHLFSSFIQDEITFFSGLFKVTLGTKLQHNHFSGFDIQPSSRFSWFVNSKNTVWAAVSRAVRAPSRMDVDYHIPTYKVPPNQPSVDGGPNFRSEKVTAYELGYRMQPNTKLSFSLATFFNNIDDLYSVEALPGTLTYQIQNGSRGEAYGFEFSGNYQLSNNWRLRGGYTYFDKTLWRKPGNVSAEAVLTNLGSDAKHQVMLQSIMDLPGNFQVDLTGRYIDSLPATQYYKTVPSYYSMDARLAWHYKNRLEVSAVGQNLLKERHVEFAGVEIPRSIYGRVTWRY